MIERTRADLERALAAAVGERLQRRDDLQDATWRFFEKRNLNLHRVVAHWRPATRPASIAELGDAVRCTLAGPFHRAWWRGLGFGVVVEADELPFGVEDVKALIDGRENVRGTWQWLVLVSRRTEHALGVHTWVEGYLSPVYRALLDELEHSGLELTRAVKQRDGLMQLLTAAKPRLFPDFRDA